MLCYDFATGKCVKEFTVDDEAIVAAVRWLHREARVVAEPSGAAAVAGVLQSRSIGVSTVAVISGGNVSAESYATYIS